VGVDRDRRDAKRVAKDHVGRLPSHAGKLLEGFPVGGDLAVVLLEEASAHLDDVFRFAAIKPNLPDLGLEGFVRQRGEILGRVVFGKKPCSHHVDPLVGALGRKDRRDQQLKRRREVEFAFGVGIHFGQRVKDPPAPFFRSHVDTSSFLGLKDIIGGRSKQTSSPR